MRNVLAAILIGLGVPATAATVTELEARSEASLATLGGKMYEPDAVQEFWGDAQFLRLCVPPGATPERLVIYVEILEDGSMGQLEVVPNTMAGACIADKVRGKRFPKPPGNFVLRINLTIRK